MLILEPERVKLGGTVMEGVTAVAVSEEAVSLIEEGGEGGPYAVMVDAPRRAVRVEVKQTLTETTVSWPLVGSEDSLEVEWSTGGRAGARRKLSVPVVVIGVRYDLGAGAAKRVVELAGVSEDGSQPVTAG